MTCENDQNINVYFYLKQQFTGNNNKQDNFKRKMPPWQSLSLDLGKLKAHSKV
jgi:hypothetical protein